MRNEARLALSRAHLRDSAVLPQTVDEYVSCLTQFSLTESAAAPELEDAVFAGIECAYGFERSSREERKPFVYQDGIAVVPVHGALLNRFNGSWGFATGYQYIRAMLNAALEDDDVRLIAYDHNSPGGEAAGCLELAKEIRAAREIKPSIAVVDALSASASYALASAATRMVATPSSKIGSIGTMLMHIDLTGALDQAGVKITLIEAPEGGMKTAGSPFRVLDRRAEKEFQASINKSYDQFVATVVENRGLSDDEVRDTEARVFRAEEALALGLIDEVKTPSEAVSDFMGELADDTDHEEDDEMKTPTPGSEATSAAPAAASAAPAAAPAAPAPAVDQAAINTAVANALQADRERSAAIKALPEAANRPKLADKLAADGFTVEQSKGLLAAAAEETAAAPAAPAAPGAESAVDQTNHLANAMDQTKQPEVGAGGGGSGPTGEKPSDEDLAASILKDQGAVVGRNFGEQSKAA